MVWMELVAMNNLPYGILRCVQRLYHLPSARGWVLFDQSPHILLKLRCSSRTCTTRITFWHLTKGKHCKELTLLWYSIYWCTCNKHKLLCYVHTWNFPASLSRLSMAANEEYLCLENVLHTIVQQLYHCNLLCRMRAPCRSFLLSCTGTCRMLPTTSLH